jgi:hypothetical protein
MLTDEQQLEKYLNKCAPPIGCDKEANVDFFRLIGLIWEHFEGYRNNIEKFVPHDPLELSCELIDKQFGTLFSQERSQLIKRCLRLRRKKLLEVISLSQREEELSHAD